MDFMMITQSTNLQVNHNILSQFKETNELEKSYQSKIKSLKEDFEKPKI